MNCKLCGMVNGGDVTHACPALERPSTATPFPPQYKTHYVGCPRMTGGALCTCGFTVIKTTCTHCGGSGVEP